MITRDDISSFHADMVLHCRMCLDERPENISPKDWSRLSFGSFHKHGEAGIYLQLWCDRHECNVTTIHIQTEQWDHVDNVPLRIAGIEENQDN